MYSVKKSAKEIYEALDKKYKSKDASTKKFVAGCFLDYKIVDPKAGNVASVGVPADSS